MSKFNWRNGFAIGLASGLAVAVTIILFHRFGYALVKCMGTRQCDGYAAQFEGKDLPEWWWWRWTGDLVTSSDTLAQWIMAVLTIVAVFLLWGTLRQANQTNKAAMAAASAALDANQIMRAEQRPWVTLEREVECEFSEPDNTLGKLCWNYDLVNKGKTPAYGIETYVKLIKQDDAFAAIWGIEEFARECREKRGGGRVAMLFPNGNTNHRKYSNFASQTYETARDGNGRIVPIPVEEKHIGVMFCVTYRLGLSENSEIGAEARAFVVKRDDLFLGPWRHKMLEYGSRRIVY